MHSLYTPLLKETVVSMLFSLNSAFSFETLTQKSVSFNELLRSNNGKIWNSGCQTSYAMIHNLWIILISQIELTLWEILQLTCLYSSYSRPRFGSKDSAAVRFQSAGDPGILWKRWNNYIGNPRHQFQTDFLIFSPDEIRFIGWLDLLMSSATFSLKVIW